VVVKRAREKIMGGKKNVVTCRGGLTSKGEWKCEPWEEEGFAAEKEEEVEGSPDEKSIASREGVGEMKGREDAKKEKSTVLARVRNVRHGEALPKRKSTRIGEEEAGVFGGKASS